MTITLFDQSIFLKFFLPFCLHCLSLGRIVDGAEQIQRLLLLVIGRCRYLKRYIAHQVVSTMIDGDRLKMFDEGAKAVGWSAIVQLFVSRLAFGSR